jgi:copper chaperone CopZ
MKSQQFEVRGMHCVGCAMAVDGALEEVPGVKRAATNYARQIVDIDYDEARVTPQQLAQAVSATGYTLSTEPRQR